MSLDCQVANKAQRNKTTIDNTRFNQMPFRFRVSLLRLTRELLERRLNTAGLSRWQIIYKQISDAIKSLKDPSFLPNGCIRGHVQRGPPCAVSAGPSDLVDLVMGTAHSALALMEVKMLSNS